MRLFNLLAIAVFCGMSLPNLMWQGGSPQALSGDQVVERVSPSAVSILVGKGDGQVAGVASGVIIRSDGVILTANHVVRGMREVQVRLKSGETYDQVELIASDERRDVAALRIPATGLPVLPIGGLQTRHLAQRFLLCRTLWAYLGLHPRAS
jgi:S1-C subfamily serine protease